MKKKRQQKPTRSDLKAFLRDLASIDWKILLGVFTVLFISLFVSQKVLFSSAESGVIFGIQTDFFEKPFIQSSPVTPLKPANYPKKITNIDAPEISAKSAIVMDVASQVVLYGKEPDTRLLPASTTKIMTAILAMDYFQPDDVLIVPKFTIEGAKMGLIAGEEISFESLLYGLLLNSGNDAAETIAANSPLGKAAFITAMNKKANELSLFHTHFNNVTGLEGVDHYTTALDLARLASFARKNSEFAKIVATKKFVVTDVSGRLVHPLENVNKLLDVVAGADGVKTGFTEEAGQVLVAAATRNSHTILTVVLKSDDRFLDSKNLLEWAFANHEFVQATTQ